MCLLRTACEIVFVGICSLYKNVRLLKAVLEGQWSIGSVFNAIYYSGAAMMAVWLILAVLA
ncbi:hypothetical protein MTO96_045915, partial [Rhipicephalus appendiculatus]